MADEQTNIRLPVPLKRRLEDEAHQGRRTFTAEVVGRLEQSLEGGGDTAALRQELEYVKLLAEERRRAADMVVVLDKTLAGIVHRVIARLPEDQREAGEVRLWATFAETVEVMGSEKMVDALGADLLGIPAQDIEEHRRIRTLLARARAEQPPLAKPAKPAAKTKKGSR